jgi:hypothetical protein
MAACRPPTDRETEAYLDDLEGLCDRLAQDLDEALDVLVDLVGALDDADRQQQTEGARRHLALVARRARGVIRRIHADPDPPPDRFDTFLGHLVADYLGTLDNPNQYFGPGAPDPRGIMAAATRWGVSEGRLTRPEAERILEQIDTAPEH